MSDSPHPPPSPTSPIPKRPSHAPTNPSRLRTTVISSPEGGLYTLKSRDEQEASGSGNGSSWSPLLQEAPTSHATVGETVPLLPEEENEVHGNIIEPSDQESDERTALLEHYHHTRVCGLRNCNHGTFSPRAPSIASTNFDSLIEVNREYGGGYPGADGNDDNTSDIAHSILGDRLGDTLTGKKKPNASKWLAKTHGIKNSRYVYFSYYFPFFRWIPQYRWEWFRGDLAAAVTMASFYIPMSLSYASNLGHIPPVNGLYAFVFNPIIYALLGTCPQMVVGPEAPGSLLVGSVVAASIDRGDSMDGDDVLNAQIAGVVTGIAGAIIFIAGLTRLGFLDSVLSRPFLRGFISAIGFVILVDQAIPELGLSSEVPRHEGVQHGSTATKLVFIFENIARSHGLTAAVSLGSFAIAMFFRELKKRLQSRYPSVAYFPDRFIVVVGSAVLAYLYSWDKQGLELLGPVKAGGGQGIPFHWPFQFKHVKHIDTALSTGLLIALLGFFESSVAAKSLAEGTSGLKGVNISANRELIALGAANIIGGCFQALPAFGGYGRSKVNKSTGGTTPMSSILLSLISLLCALFMLPYFYYLPKGVLSAMVSVVAYSLVEEAPHDISFFIKIRGWTELGLMAIIFLSTIFYSLSVGIALGIGLSLLSIIRHSTKPRIQILGRVPGQPELFENAELFPGKIEYIEGCLIVKIPEPLTFANTGALKTRLSRLEKYGTNEAHPSLPRMRNAEHNKNVIFDVHGVTSIDGSGTQVLMEIVESYVKRGVRVIFCRLPSRRARILEAFERSGIIELCGGRRHFVNNIEEALKLSEQEDFEQYFTDQANGSG